MNLKYIGVRSRNWIEFAQVRDYWRALINAELMLRVPQVMELINRLVNLFTEYKYKYFDKNWKILTRILSHRDIKWYIPFYFEFLFYIILIVNDIILILIWEIVWSLTQASHDSARGTSGSLQRGFHRQVFKYH